MKVICQDGKFEIALRKFKKKVADSQTLQTLREREFFVKPSTQRKIAKGKAVSRWKKYIRDQELPKKNY